MKLEEGKYYRTRGGEKVRCIAVSSQDYGEEYGALCKSQCHPIPWSYTIDGCFVSTKQEHVEDIIAEWKEKQTAKLAPAVFETMKGSFYVSDKLFESEEEARRYGIYPFVKWLIGTPYEIEVEVEG
jgi:hypothetical protein